MNGVIRLQQPGPNVPAPGTMSGSWMWDGNEWVCNPCPPCPPIGSFPGQPPWCAPPGFPPPGCPPWFSGQNSPPWYPGANAGVSFGTSPPANPVRGHFWWDGKELWIWDGAVWDAVGGAAGGVTPPQGTAPANPVPGQQWFDGKTLWVWDGNAWVPVSQTKTYIQATAPPAPNPGDLWWNGTQMHIWDGSAWEIVGPGATVGPVPTTTAVFSIGSATDISGGSLTGTAWSILALANAPSIDTESAWNAGTHQYKPSKAGFYLFETSQSYGGSETAAGNALIKNDPGSVAPDLSGAIVVATNNYAGSAGTASLALNASGMTYMNGTTDFVRLWALAATGTYEILSPAVPVLQGYLLP